MGKTRAEKVRQAIKQIRAFHRLGRESLKEREVPAAYGDRAAEIEAERRGINPDLVRKARQFADAEIGYTCAELDELCRQIRTTQPAQDDSRAIVGKTHVLRLLTISPKRRRAALQREAIERGWSTGRLEREILRRFGTRRAGGRRTRIPAELPEALAQIEKMCEQWRRWLRELERLPEADDEKRVMLDGFPAKIRRHIRTADVSVTALHKAVAAELQERQRGRKLRHVFRED